MSASTILSALAMVAGALSSACSSSSGGTGGGGVVCYPDNDGIDDDVFTIAITVDDDGFSKKIISTQNQSQVTLTLKNAGTKPHGFEVACTDARASYPNLPTGCSPEACFPDDSKIAPIDPGKSTTITFDTPTPDGLIYPFQSGAPGDADVKALNDGQWSLM